jgi:hypothetical protein
LRTDVTVDDAVSRFVGLARAVQLITKT